MTTLKSHSSGPGHSLITAPLLFSPVYKDYIWGGNRIATTYDRDLPEGIYAESWEVADRPEGMSVVSDGPLTGCTLHELTQQFGADLVGTAAEGERFPLLIKIIDSKQRLSVQVHPNNANAAAVGGEPKTEMWYVLAADAGAGVFAGLRSGTNSADFRKALEEGRLEEAVNFLPVAAGDAIFVPGGRIHAIDDGCLLLEIQQNSNTTYRVHDWGRVGHDGKPRPLHIEEAMQVIDWNDAGDAKVKTSRTDMAGGNSVKEIVCCPYFNVEELQLATALQVKGDGSSFEVWFVAEGGVTLQAEGTRTVVARGVSCLVPAALREYSLEPASGASRVIRTRLSCPNNGYS